MMSQGDRRRLQAIEDHIAAADPAFARRVRRLGTAVGQAGRLSLARGLRVLVWVVVSVGAVVLGVGILAGAPEATLTGVALVAGSLGARWLLRRQGDR